MTRYSGATGRPIAGSSSKSKPKTKIVPAYDKNTNYSQEIKNLIAKGNYSQSALDKLSAARDAKIKGENMGSSVNSTSKIVSSARAMNPQATDYISQYTGGQTQAKNTPMFESLVPYDSFVNKLNPYAETKVNPEAMRTTSDLVKQYEKGASSRGGYQFSSFNSNKGDLLGKLERQRQTDISNVQNQFKTTLDDVYKRYSEQYYRDPNLDSFGGKIGNVQTTLNNAANSALPGFENNSLMTGATPYNYKPNFTFY